MRTLFLFFWVVFLPLVSQAEWVVQPRQLVNGGVAVLRWQGEPAMDVAVARHSGETFFLDRDEKGMFALVGIDVMADEGISSLEVAGIDTAGENHFKTIHLSVTDAERPVDRLTLPPHLVTPQDPETLKRIERESAELRKIFNRNSGPFFGGEFSRPVPEPISSPFGTRRILNGTPKSPHSGTDFRSPLGRLVGAPAKGRVVFIEDLYYTGLTVVLDHGNGIYSLFAHLSRALVELGQELDIDQPLGRVGSTGRSTGAHLHWTMKIRGNKIDPMELLARYGQERP